MKNKLKIEELQHEVDILSRKINMLAQMFKEYVESESSPKMDAGKWYQSIDKQV